jgi:hypothetical protein
VIRVVDGDAPTTYGRTELMNGRFVPAEATLCSDSS